MEVYRVKGGNPLHLYLSLPLVLFSSQEYTVNNLMCTFPIIFLCIYICIYHTQGTEIPTQYLGDLST